jgi:hypothetical protein
VPSSLISIVERVLRMLPIALLIVVALHQISLAHRAALSPWSGGGFGMFSTLDHGGRRHLHAFVLRPGLRREVVPPPALADEIKRALTLPTDVRLGALAGALAKTPTPDHGPLAGVQIQVWHTRFDPETLTPISQLLREFVLRLEMGE